MHVGIGNNNCNLSAVLGACSIHTWNAITAVDDVGRDDFH